jgi:preprotein translocase subunit SecE
MHYFLGLKVWQKPGLIFLRQGKYAVEILKRFRMMECKSMTTPIITYLNMMGVIDSYLMDPMMYMTLIGSLMYLFNTKPDIYFVANTFSRFMVESRKVHWVARQHVLRYLWGTIVFGMICVGFNLLPSQVI